MRKWPTLFGSAVVRSSTSTLASERSVEQAESVKRLASKTQAAEKVNRRGSVEIMKI